MYSPLQMFIQNNSTVLFLMIALLLNALPLAAVSADFKTDVEATVASDADFLPLGGEVDRLLGASHSLPTSSPRQEQEP